MTDTADSADAAIERCLDAVWGNVERYNVRDALRELVAATRAQLPLPSALEHAYMVTEASLRTTLAARPDESATDAARRVVRERDEALSTPERDRLRRLARERDEARTEVDRLTRELAEARAQAERERNAECTACLDAEIAHDLLWTKERRETAGSGNVCDLVRVVLAELDRACVERDMLRAAHDNAIEALPAVQSVTLSEAVSAVLAERDKLASLVEWYRLGNVPRLLGCAPDQLEAVRAVLRTLVARKDGPMPYDVERAVSAWIAAGKPLASGGDGDGL